MAQYMVMVYDAFSNCYLYGYQLFFDDEDSAIEAAKAVTEGFIEQRIDYLEADVFIHTLGMGDYQMIGYISYDCDPWDIESIEFEECYC